jgi:protein-L-isoaspartate O-methyltransferase
VSAVRETSLPDPWDRAAAGWNAHGEVIRSWLREVTHAMLDAARITTGSRVLDIAAGAGDQTLDIARRVGTTGHVLATDLSERILTLAACNAQAHGFTQVHTRVADAQALEMVGSNFDAAICRLGLMFCANPLLALTEARRALKPGGRFSAVVFSAPQQNPCLTITMAIASRYAGLPPDEVAKPGSLLSLGRPGLLAKLLGEAGFVDIDVQAVAAPFRLPNSQSYVDFVRAAGSPIMALLANAPVEQQVGAWEDMAVALSRFNTPTGWEGPNELLLCSATAP